MEENQKKEFICKFCNKKFPCGKSLGGHIRTHLSGNGKNSGRKKQEEEEKKAQVTITKFSSLSDISKSQRDSSKTEAGLNSGYELRMNPRKSWRFTDPINPLRGEEKICKECGKGFQSLKALCGHMASHSEKEKLINNNYEEEEEEYDYDYDYGDDLEGNGKQKLVMDSLSDTETCSAPRQRRISKRTKKYNNIEVHHSLANGSSSVSGIEQEQQDVAISLMMLSRDSGYKGGLNSFAESSDNNSVILEAKSSSIDMVGSTKEVLNSAPTIKVKDIVQMKKAKDGKLKFTETIVSENSDLGYYIGGPKKIESDVSAYGFQTNGDSVKKLEVESGSGIKGYDGKFGHGTTKGKNLLNEEAKNQVERSSKYELRKRTKDGFCKPKFLFDSFNKETNSSSNFEISRDSHKKSIIFRSHGSLRTQGGNNSKTNGFSGSMHESGENSIETDFKLIEVCSSKYPNNNKFSGNAESKSGSNKKSKGHECPICFRVFKSGQALGGHKRSHFIGGYEDKTVVIRQESSETEISRFFDLNLPAPIEEAANGHVGFMTW